MDEKQYAVIGTIGIDEEIKAGHGIVTVLGSSTLWRILDAALDRLFDQAKNYATGVEVVTPIPERMLKTTRETLDYYWRLAHQYKAAGEEIDAIAGAIEEASALLEKVKILADEGATEEDVPF